jgi:ABC-2 type transport system permease protein
MNYSDIRREARFILSKKSAVLLLIVIFLLSAFAVWTGTEEVTQQRETIERLIKADEADRADVFAKKSDYGTVGYYAFNLTYDEPSNLAFAALGSRDSLPWKHRVRALALEAQIYQSDTGNPEMALAGRIDFNFIISILAPLLVILLLHDLKASERSSRRYDLLSVTAHHASALWKTRVLVTILLISVALLVPFWIGGVINSSSVTLMLGVSALAIAHVTLWGLICYWFSKKNASAPRLASILLGLWFVCTFIIPAAANVVINRYITGPQGGEILITHREAVNDAWEIPLQDTMDEFVATHPQWRDYTEIDGLFEWKWYFAFHQVGDQRVADLAQAYQDTSEKKYSVAGWTSWLSPSTFISRTMTRLAETDSIAAWEYEQEVRDYHASLRKFFYPYLFTSPEFDRSNLKKMPKFREKNVKEKDV